MSEAKVIKIQAPLPHQRGPLDSSARFKVWRKGRRWGKTRGAFIACCIGHGAKPNGIGFIDGGEIIWIARDYPNSDTVWRKEVIKRFANKPGFNINKQDRRVECESGGGSLTICSADNIDSIRGGDWDGVIIDEAAHIDLDNVWSEVVRPGLADRKGWAIIMSTTYTGSYFNQLCEKVIAGEYDRDDGTSVWEHSHGTAKDNPKIDPREIDDMIREYHDEVKLRQEVYADLVVPGGYAFPEWDPNVHVNRGEVPVDWTWVGCIDYNYAEPGWFGLAGVNGERVAFRWGYKFQRCEPFDLGFRIGSIISARFTRPVYIVGDAQMWASTVGMATIASEFQAGMNKAYGDQGPALIPGPKGPNSRIQSKVLMHKKLAFEKDNDGQVKPWKAPLMTFHPDCTDAILTIPKLTRDEKNPEDVDTKGPDWCLAPGTRLLTTRGWLPIAEIPEARVTARDAETVRLSFSRGDDIVCTPNHRIMTTEGWWEAGDLQQGQEILWWSPKPAKSLRECDSIGAPDTSCAPRSSRTGISLAAYGSQTSVLSRTDTTFTIATATPPTTDSPTLSVYRGPSTSLIIPVTLQPHSERLVPGTQPDHAETAISQCLERSAPVRLLKVTRHGKLPTLYDVGVAHPFHGFVSAGGIVTHNCYDAVRYLVMQHAPAGWRNPSDDRPEYRPDRHPGYHEGTRRKWKHEDDDDVPSSRYVRA